MNVKLHECKLHGKTIHYSTKSRLRCKKCNVIAVSRRRKEIKIKSIEYLGKCCKRCGLIDSCPAVYDFHHLDPTLKDFSISVKGYTYSWDKVKNELDKCILLCANCHRKQHYKEEPFPVKVIRSKNTNMCVCGKKLARKSKACISCTKRDRIVWPKDEVLLRLVEESNYVKVGKYLGVSDNAIRKRLNRNKLITLNENARH